MLQYYKRLHVLLGVGSILLHSSSVFISAFVPGLVYNNHYYHDYGLSRSYSASSSSSSSLHAIGVLARKAKENDVRAYVEAGIETTVMEQVRKLDAYLASTNNNNDHDDNRNDNVHSTMGPVQQALTKRKGTLSIIAEYKRHFQDSGFIAGEIYEPILISPVFREFGAAAIAVTTDARIGGATYTDLQVFVQEQMTAKGNVPGPLCIINNDLIVDPVQLCRSAAYGAQAVVVHLAVVGLDKAKYLLRCARGLNVECMIAVSNGEEAQVAIEQVGASILYVVGLSTTDEKTQVLQHVSSTIVQARRPICMIADILAKDNKGLEEVEEAWVCRDQGFNAVWVSDALYKAGNDPTEHCGAIIKSMKAKSSVKWASAKARSGKGEGAREYLGDILM